MTEKSIFNFMIQYKDGTLLDLHEDKNIWVTSFRILSPTPDHVTERLDGRHGSILLETTLLERKIHAKFSVEGVDFIDFDLLRDELFRIFNPLNKFYIIRDLQKGKRMEVSVDGDFDLDYITLEDGEFEMDFIIHSTFIESIGTTLSPFSFEFEMWQIGQGLQLDTDDILYEHNTTSFRIFNAGDVPVDPRVHPMKITYTGPSDQLIIRNKSTNEEFRYNGITTESDVLVLDGIRTLKNGVSVLKDTNRKLLTIAPSINEFEILGNTGAFTITFDFKYYYL